MLMWPVRAILGVVMAIFWFINDVIERIVDGIGALFTRLFPPSHDRQAAKKRARRTRRRMAIFAGIVLAILLLFELFPFYFVIITSFKSEVQITTFESLYWPDPWTLDQYVKLLGPTRNFLVWMRNSFIVSIITPLISTLVASLAAYGLVRLTWRGSRCSPARSSPPI